jgi:hypothetical protein
LHYVHECRHQLVGKVAKQGEANGAPIRAEGHGTGAIAILTWSRVGLENAPTSGTAVSSKINDSGHLSVMRPDALRVIQYLSAPLFVIFQVQRRW